MYFLYNFIWFGQCLFQGLCLFVWQELFSSYCLIFVNALISKTLEVCADKIYHLCCLIYCSAQFSPGAGEYICNASKICLWESHDFHYYIICGKIPGKIRTVCAGYVMISQISSVSPQTREITRFKVGEWCGQHDDFKSSQLTVPRLNNTLLIQLDDQL